ncbi:hypothetical protein PR048_021640 [Dryococelus australis]|uniref:DDE-1 domain-containing protein n=1 Tax=Dryococelus australis TaxID=614101 RepID=A0ABQ9GYR9_9NEOP|nr:hypothetical protein PR048_021640 [Dryococelus australis]
MVQSEIIPFNILKGKEKIKAAVFQREVPARCMKLYIVNRTDLLTVLRGIKQHVLSGELSSVSQETTLAVKNDPRGGRKHSQEQRTYFSLTTAQLVHATVQLRNVKLVFLPLNCTSMLQPLDQGVFRLLNHHLHIMLVHSLLQKVEFRKELVKWAVIEV